MVININSNPKKLHYLPASETKGEALLANLRNYLTGFSLWTRKPRAQPICITVAQNWRQGA